MPTNRSISCPLDPRPSGFDTSERPARVRPGQGLRDLVPAGPDELAAFETDVPAEFVLALAVAGVPDQAVNSDVT